MMYQFQSYNIILSILCIFLFYTTTILTYVHHNACQYKYIKTTTIVVHAKEQRHYNLIPSKINILSFAASKPSLPPPNPSSSSSNIKHIPNKDIVDAKSNNRNRPSPRPIQQKYWPQRFPAKNHCSKCGLCETTFVQYVDSSCAFLNEGMAKIDSMEENIHGRRRHNYSPSSGNGSSPHRHDDDMEDRFGVLYQPILLAKGIHKIDEESSDQEKNGNNNSQWTGVVTNIAVSMLEQNLVDAVICISSASKDDWSEPKPIIAKTVQDIRKGSGVKPSLAPSLNILDQVKNDESIKRLLFCGVGCAVQAFRSVEDKLGLEEVFVLGTNCADNSPTSNAANEFVRDGLGIDDLSNVKGYEFMQDFRVHVKMKKTKNDQNNNKKDEIGDPKNHDESNGNNDVDSYNSYIKKPYFCLPGKVAENTIADSCLACFDYTNALADVVVGYMGAPLDNKDSDGGGTMATSYQTLTCRNKKGKLMIETAIKAKKVHICQDEAKEKSKGGMFMSYEDFAVGTVKADSIVLAMVEKEIPQQGMPLFIGEILASILNNTGPKGLDFAAYSIDYHLLRNYLHVLDEWGLERAEQSIPHYAKGIIQEYLEKYEEFRTLRSTILDKNINRQQ